MRQGKFLIFLYYGWEADDFRDPDRPTDKYRNWYEMFRSVLIDYKLPTNSIIIAQSNLLGYKNEKEYDPKFASDRKWQNIFVHIYLTS